MGGFREISFLIGFIFLHISPIKKKIKIYFPDAKYNKFSKKKNMEGGET